MSTALRTATSAILLILAIVAPSQIATAASDSSGFVVDTHATGGIGASITEATAANMRAGLTPEGRPLAVPMEYSTQIACQVASPTDPNPSSCQKAAAGCVVNGALVGIGVLYLVLQRPAGTAAWQVIGTTCFRDQIPGATPTPSLAMIRQAFHDTPWSVPGVSTQPAGNVTLVGLDTYWQVAWSQAGFEPAEVEDVDPTLMFGHQVRIRPVLVGYTYVFGDGVTEGPTMSAGGVYPSGDVIHAYRSTGTFPTRVNVAMTGDFSLDGGPWVRIPDSVTIAGPVTTVQVREAPAQLINPASG